MSSSTENYESGSEVGSIQIKLYEDKHTISKPTKEKYCKLDYNEEWDLEQQLNEENSDNMSTSNHYPGLNNPSTTSECCGPGYASGFHPDDSADEPLGGGSNRYPKRSISSHEHTFYEPPFQPPSNSSYSHYCPPNIMDQNSGYPSTAIRQVPWYQPPIGGGSHEQMINMLHFSNSNGREARNRAEKNRRDKLNGSIQELSTMVPHVAESPRRVDKTAVLRFSAHGLRVHYVFGKTLHVPPKVKPQVTDSLMKLLDSFLLTITCRGQIVLVSPSVEQHLGHCQTDLFGQNILHITHPDDHSLLKKQIIPTDLETLFDIHPEEESGSSRPRTQDEEDEIDRRLREDNRNFTIRLARAGPRSEPTTYEVVKIDGCFRRADSAPRRVKSNTFSTGLQLIRRARGRDDSIPLHTISGNDIVLVAMARIIKPPKLCDRLIESTHYEYKTRHLIDGRIVQCDQRISLVAGYMTDEVNGLSPFTFMHQDDVRWVIVALRQMYDCNSAYGESCYRLITRTGKFVYLRTRGYLEIDKDTNKVHSFVCVNTLVSDDEGKKRVEDMKNKFSIIINTKIPTSAEDAPAAENPHQLERAIIYLIQNLHPAPGVNEDSESQETNKEDTDNNLKCRLKTPPLAIIPPKPCTIKSSITKSINVVNITASKHLHRIRTSKFKNTADSASGSSDSGDNSKEGRITCRASVPQRNESCSSSNINSDSRTINSDTNLELNNITLKVEADYEESRVPPLPDSKGYFELKTYTELTSRNDFMSGDIRRPSALSYSSPSCRTTTVLKRMNNVAECDENSSATKRRNIVLEVGSVVSRDGGCEFITPSIQELTNPNADLTQLLPSSFEAIDRTLMNIETVTTELKSHCSTYDVNPSSQGQLEEIIEEQQEQREMLENIQSEFQAHLKRTSPTILNLSPGSKKKSELKPR